MKKLLNLTFLLSVCLFCGVLAGCDSDKIAPSKGDFNLTISETGPDYVKVFVTAPKEMEIAYMVSDEPILVTPRNLFKKGTMLVVKPGDTFEIKDINEKTEYVLYSVGRLDEMTFTDIIQVEFKTTSHDFDSMLTLMDTYPDGFKMHITVPEATKQRGNAISYGYGNRALYNMNLFNSRGGGEAFVDMTAVASGSAANNDYCFKDTTIVINDNNQIAYDEDGNPLLGSAGEYITIHDPYIPGEPMIFIAGETRYGTSDDFAEVVGYVQPPHDNWSVPMFDRTTMSWTGEFAKMDFFTDMPELCEATLDISFPEDKLGINDAVVAFTPKGDIFRYYYTVLNKMAYEEIMTIFLDHDKSLLQWFLVSWVAANYYTLEYDTEATYINAASFFTEPLNGGETYYVLATILGDEEGLTQRFVMEEFTTKKRTKPAPVIEVTTVDTGSPYLAGFNIKAGADSRGNVQEVKGAYWACEYSREWEKYINAKYDYPSIIKSSYQVFTAEELAEVNSEKGLTLYFDTLDGETMRFGAYGCNDEYCFNIVDADNNKAWADYKAPMADVDKASVDSPLFTELLGDWTATATMRVKHMLEDGSIDDMMLKHQSKVVISDKAPELPDVVDPYIYELYGGKTDDVNGMFEELQLLTDMFTEYRLEKQNRLLCNGFLDFDGAKSNNYPVGRLDYRTPYFLFQATDYSSVDVAQLIYDFGPKWFLEVLEDGSVIVPFSTVTMPPLTAWPGYPFYIGGVGNSAAFYEATSEIKGFPVEVSADYRTITIKPIVIEEDTPYLEKGSYYMNALGVQPMSSDLEILGTITTDIVLTKGWNEAATASVKSLRPTSVTPVSLDGTQITELPEIRKMRSTTDLRPEELPQYKLDETPNIITVDMIHKSVEELSKLNYMTYGRIE